MQGEFTYTEEILNDMPMLRIEYRFDTPEGRRMVTEYIVVGPEARRPFSDAMDVAKTMLQAFAKEMLFFNKFGGSEPVEV